MNFAEFRLENGGTVLGELLLYREYREPSTEPLANSVGIEGENIF
jgi:hypothetical protein